MGRGKIIYYINDADVQNVAQDQLGRKLNRNELKRIEEKLGDHIKWYDAIDATIKDCIAINRTRRAIPWAKRG